MRQLATLHAQSRSRGELMLYSAGSPFFSSPGAQCMEWLPIVSAVFSSPPDTSQVYSVDCLLDKYLLCQFDNQY